jgi:hypothetical protein
MLRGPLLPDGIGLFERGDPDDSTDAQSFVMRMNRNLFIRAMDPIGYVRQDLVTAINVRGQLGRQAELVVFGGWLFDGMPGRGSHPGRAPDLHRLLKVATAALAAFDAQSRAQKDGDAAAAAIRTSDIARFWKRLFDQDAKTSDHSSALRSLRSILPDYLSHLKTGGLDFNGQKVTASPLMSEFARALARGPFLRTNLANPSFSTPAATTAPTSFQIPLGYSSPETEKEYRNLAVGRPPLPSLPYKITPVKPTSERRPLRADRKDSVVLQPDIDVRDLLKVTALIDRIAFTVTTEVPTTHGILQNAVTKAGVTSFVWDRTRTLEQIDWRASLPQLDMTHGRDRHFAVMIQDPTPVNLRAALGVIDMVAGLEGEVQPCLVELALDFFPRRLSDQSDALVSREQIVGLLQRHLWSAGGEYAVDTINEPRHADPRQVFHDGSRRQTRYLFADGNDRVHSDVQLGEASVRKRLIDAKPGNHLYLNSGIYRGSMNGPKQTNVQHKIADRRNVEKATHISLKNQDRRARVELTLTSLETLDALGLKTVGDLAHFSFRSLSRKMIAFRLPTCSANVSAIEVAMKQMKTRGIYGVEMNQRAAMFDVRLRTRPRPRSTDRDGFGLVDWPVMNEVVGAALDRLSARWRRF